MGNPKDLSLGEIRNYMLLNNCKVTNHALVKHFKQFLTNPDTQIEARKQFKTFVNILSTIKNENNEKYLILRKKYVNEAPPEDLVHNSSAPMSPDARSVISDGEQSPFRPNQPPPYRHPPEFSPTFGTPPPPVAKAVPVLTNPQYKECVDEFKTALTVLEGRMQPQGSIDSQSSGNSRKSSVDVADTEPPPPVLPPRRDRQLSRENSSNNNSEKIDAIKESVVIEKSESVVEDNKENDSQDNNDNKISVKEATRKFNRYASVEEAKVPSPLGKKKPDKDLEESQSAENLLQHPKAKEWLLSAARSNYQDLAKLAQEHPKLVKVQDPNTTALHWAAKHGNVDVVKLIAGSYRADVNSTTNGGYTALHLAMQFGRNDIFELLCNVYKADRDCMDYSGKKPLDYQKQMTSVSESTYSKIKAKKKHSEKDLGFLRIGSLNVRVKKTTEAFSNFLGVGQTTTRIPPNLMNARNSAPSPQAYLDKNLHKNWGSADNLPQDQVMMAPPKYGGIKKRRSKREVYNSESHSMPTTPSQTRAAPIGILSEQPGEEYSDDSEAGFDSNWQGLKNNMAASFAADDDDYPVKPTYL